MKIAEVKLCWIRLNTVVNGYVSERYDTAARGKQSWVSRHHRRSSSVRQWCGQTEQGTVETNNNNNNATACGRCRIRQYNATPSPVKHRRVNACFRSTLMLEISPRLGQLVDVSRPLLILGSHQFLVKQSLQNWAQNYRAILSQQ